MCEDLLEIGERPGIVRLSEPEDGILADRGVAIGLRYVKQLRDSFVLRQLAERKHCLLLYRHLGIVLHGVFERRRGQLLAVVEVDDGIELEREPRSGWLTGVCDTGGADR